ncbi:unnamed protein product [Oppiella nova]|uniref:folate gamma-glutamyl hydrolase n=1 Tax=Oppiella nova TaxID=334625 RepID=A0A7R9LP74_9ACAR|nr:unnamed protein product [Oppiella nova]CAG2165230.1 unnamed protein product [Oppiella nova]
MVSMNWSLCVLLAVTLYQPSRALTDRPLVGILAQEYWHTGSVNQSYIAASYVKFVESAGARVVPVMINETDEYYKTIVDETNGLLIPGGGQDLHTSGFANAGRALLKYAQANLTRHYPIWSTCLGFELISQLMSNTTALGDCDTDDVSLPLNMTPGFMDSRLFSGADPTIVNILTEEAVTYNHHKRCLTLEAYQASDLKNKFKILSTNTDGKGVEFVSTWESVSGDPPIYGVQWHPEKNAYEYDYNIEYNENSSLLPQRSRGFSQSLASTIQQSIDSSNIWKYRNYNNNNTNDIKKQGAGWIMAAFLLVNAALGAGLLNYPVAYDRLGGVGISTIIQLIMLLLLASTMVILVYCADLNGVSTYHEVLECMCGHTVRQTSALSIMITCFGICVTFLIIIGDQFDRIFATFFGSKFCEHWYLNRVFTIVFTTVVTVWPMSYFKRLDFLKHTNLLGVFATFYVIFLNVYEYYRLDVKPGPIRTYPSSIMSFLAALPVVCFAYQTHEIVVPVYACLSHRTTTTFMKSTGLALSVLFVVYCISGTFGYYTFGGTVAPDVMQMYNASDPIVSAGIVALIVKMITTYPPVIFCGRDTFVGLFCKHPEPIQLDEPYDSVEYWRRVFITSTWNILALILALVIPNITIAIGFLGSLAACNVFVFPGLCMTALAKRRQSESRALAPVCHQPSTSSICNEATGAMKCWPRVLFIYGVFVIITGVLMFFVIIYQVINDLSADVTHHLLCQ